MKKYGTDTKEWMDAIRRQGEEMRAARKAAGLRATRTPIEAAQDNPKSLRKAITAKCYECMGGGQERGWKQLIRDCTSPKCPLWPVRPYQGVA